MRLENLALHGLVISMATACSMSPPSDGTGGSGQDENSGIQHESSNSETMSSSELVQRGSGTIAQGAHHHRFEDSCAGVTSVSYHGGALVEHPDVVAVYWSSSVDATEQATQPGFYRDFLESPATDWLSIYDAGGYHLGGGSFRGSYVISPIHTGTMLSDDDVQSELSSQIDGGYLPEPDAGTVYMIRFPVGTHVDSAGCGGTSCGVPDAVFAGCHLSANTDLGSHYRYAMLFDDCKSTTVDSHELFETITDPDDGGGWWNTISGCEIADICESGPSGRLFITEIPGRSYSISGAFYQGDFDGCIDQLQFDTADILWRDNESNLAMWFMSGATILDQGYISLVPGSDWQVQGTGDFDGDGTSDVLWRDSDGTIAIWFMNGSTITAQAYPGAPSFDWKVVLASDFNGDGMSDILWRETDGTLAIWYMNAGTILGEIYPGAPGLDWQIKGAGDFDGDGISDILWQDSDGQMAIWLMNATGVKSEIYPSPLPGSLQVVGVGDFDYDGKSDILWRNFSTGELVIWLMNGATVVSAPALPTSEWLDSDSGWSVQGVADFNGDGAADVLWRKTDGTVMVWNYVGGSAMFEGGVAGAPGNDWVIQGTGSFDGPVGD